MCRGPKEVFQCLDLTSGERLPVAPDEGVFDKQGKVLYSCYEIVTVNSIAVRTIANLHPSLVYE